MWCYLRLFRLKEKLQINIFSQNHISLMKRNKAPFLKYIILFRGLETPFICVLFLAKKLRLALFDENIWGL